MKQFINFEYMITPGILKILCYIGAAISVVIGVIALFSGATDSITAGLSFIVLGPVACRIYTELLLVIFEIHKTLKEINNKK
tara:strand:- start:291 stop:536 length:246 start_codon:yes stop_codon:yes gene_type:complete